MASFTQITSEVLDFWQKDLGKMKQLKIIAELPYFLGAIIKKG
jgi:hypothetical protein